MHPGRTRFDSIPSECRAPHTRGGGWRPATAVIDHKSSQVGDYHNTVVLSLDDLLSGHGHHLDADSDCTVPEVTGI